MSEALFNSAYDILTSRLRWETDQKTFYTMRHRGLPRQDKPFPKAADGHVSIIDNAIRKLKPYWLGQMSAGDRVCNFTSLRQQQQAMSDAAADYYDFQTAQYSRFAEEMEYVVFAMLLRGRGILKSTVDPLDQYKVVDEAIDPLFILMPQEANDFEDADEWVHVRQFTVEGYRRLDQRWDTRPETIGRIRGQPVANLQTILVQKKLQEGITNTTQTNQIIVWEHWKREGRGHTIYTYSPHSPDTPLRKPYGNPYKCEGQESIPFTSFAMEQDIKGWYASRGLAELLAPWEQFATKVLNEKADAMTFYNRPLYTGEKEIQNLANYRWQPGEYIPGKIEAVRQAGPPMSFDEMLALARGMAEEMSQAPDFGITQEGPATGKPRTATENQRISALQQTGTNHNGEVFRRQLAAVHRHRWAMLVQFNSRDWSYFAAGETNTLPEQALHDAYLIVPDGSVDGWNRLARMQKALALLQSVMGNPNVNPEPITKEILAAYGENMVQKAFVPSNQKGQTEYEDQAEKINSLLVPGSGKPPFPVRVKPQDDHVSRIKANVDWLHAAGKLGVPLDVNGARAVQQNTAEHIQMLQQQNPEAAGQIKQMLMQMEMAGRQPALNGDPMLQ